MLEHMIALAEQNVSASATTLKSILLYRQHRRVEFDDSIKYSLIYAEI